MSGARSPPVFVCPTRGIAASTPAASADSEIMRASLRVGNPELVRFQVHLVPAQVEDLVLAAAGEQQQADLWTARWSIC